MDIEKIRKWAWKVANKLIEFEGGETRTLDRFMMDLRSSNLPHDFANVIVNNMTIFRRSGIDVDEISPDLQYFNNVTEFKEAKAVIIATFHNAQVLWNRIKDLYINQKLRPEEIAEKLRMNIEVVKRMIEVIKGGERR